MKIEAMKVVAISYEVEVEGEVVDRATEEKPLDYIQGMRMIIPMLEAELEGKEEGEAFDCTIPPEEAYGEYDLTKVFDIPKSSFEVNGKLREDLLEAGKFIPMLNSAGEVCHGMVVAVKDDKVTMDFNAPMAGKTLHFTGKVVSVRDATEKELTEGLHGEFLPHEGCHRHGGCHGHHDGEGCCHGEGHGDGEGCCHGEGHHKDGEGCCHGGHGEGCCHKEG
ncbi:MAG: FKBP-type peptidyl-prolyl cis-trans isomerase [Bacteroidales bacterium]|nr:FKBP-type peptidyl-prolyl cis-trans isomerase [Bacteroidales bacterium]